MRLCRLLVGLCDQPDADVVEAFLADDICVKVEQVLSGRVLLGVYLSQVHKISTHIAVFTLLHLLHEPCMHLRQT